MTTEFEQSALTVGQILKKAREENNLTTQQVASQLNLKTSLINDLESDSVDTKLSPTFYRGYIRAYAKLLKLPEQALLAQYANESKCQQAPSLTRSFSKRTSKEASDSRFAWLTRLILLAFVGLVVIYFWQNRHDGQAVSTPLPLVQLEEPVEPSLSFSNGSDAPSDAPEMADESAEENANKSAELSSNTGAASSSQDALEQTLPSQQRPVSQGPSTDVAQVQSAPQSMSQALQTTAQSAESVALNTLAVTASSEPLASEAVLDGTLSRLKLHFSDECWVEISDVNGKRLAFGAKTAGERLEVAGVAPFKILLGNGAAVDLTFNDQAVDLSAYIQGRVARLTLGQ